MPRVSIQIEGVPELLAKMRGNSAYAWPWRDLIHMLTDFGMQQAKQRAPRRTGATAGAITSRMQASELPLWAVVTTKPGAAQSGKGFRYPFALDAGKGKRKKTGKTFVYHYRSTGKPTKKWFRGVLNLINRILRREMRKMERQIEANWNK